MRILVLTPTFLPALGGAELVVLQVYRRLAERHSIRVLTPHLSERLIDENGSTEFDHLVNFEVERFYDRVSFMKLRGHKVLRGLIPPFSLSAVGALHRSIQSFHPDVINVHYVMPTGLAGYWAQRILKKPVVVTYNGRDVPGPGVPFMWKFWHRLIGNRCADQTFVSAYCRDAIYRPGSEQGRVIYNGVERPPTIQSNQVEALKKRLNIKGRQVVLFALQRLDPLKRVDVLLRCLPRVLQHYPDTRLIIGGKGPDTARLKKIAGDLNISGHVHFAGFISQDEIPKYFNLAHLFLFHSTYETFGMVLAEAMNYGKAVISVENTAIKEVVDHGKNGILVPTSDPEAFSAAVIELLDNAEKRHQFGRNGIDKVNLFFRWGSIARQYDDVLREAAAGCNN